MPSWDATLAQPVSEPESGEGKRVRRKAGTASFSQQLKSLFRPLSSHSSEWEPRAPLLVAEASPRLQPCSASAEPRGSEWAHNAHRCSHVRTRKPRGNGDHRTGAAPSFSLAHALLCPYRAFLQPHTRQ
ncbi:hypothetical protein conserved [Leishmania donovani]|uniref:Hypothetical_protein_-__conserved n=2 Tax=Leishmania donovani species complex TaxID=38574 RepID=A0A6L0WTY6_LEIIN|nr:hypothetical_protein_-__conserved [Leishmania infantum]CAJ1986653.1 hypothetical protein conserved [Leishmania donovani]SUZ39595.1 hypothetical_protein_-__conserved [Leishmania infantum]VDZ42548.1 hypothetical_protein_conserved [Leishmania donovani]